MSVKYGGDNITFADNSVQNTAATGFGFKNRIINGAMGIWQRGTSFSSPAFGAYTVDRFYNPSGATTSITQSTDVPTGFRYSASVVGNSGGANGLAQRVESFNAQDLVGQNVTVSFWAKNSSGSDNLQVVLYYANAQDNFSGLTSIGSTVVSASPSSSWTYYTATFSSMPSGVANGMTVQVVRGQTAASTTLITGVQLEKGSTATSFDYRPYGTELALCQRYYEALSANAGTNVGAGSFITLGVCENTTRVQPYYTFKVQKRTAPSTTLSAINTFGLRSTGSSVACSSGAFGAPTSVYAQGEFNNAGGGLIAGGAGWLVNHTGAATIEWSAEL